MDDIRTYFLQSLLPGIFLTLLFYCLPVAAFQYHFNSPVSPRRAKIVSAGFAVISYVLLSVLLLSLSSNAVHASVAWIWCLINYKTLTSGYSSLEECAYQFPYEKRTVYFVSDETPPGKYLVLPTGELANVIVTDTRSSGFKTEEVIDVKSEREIKLIPGRRVACFNCEMKLKSTTKKTSNFFQRLRDKTIFATNPEKKVAYDHKSKAESNAEKTANKEEFKAAEFAPDERSNSELNCKEYKISPDYPAGTYYVISNGERPHLMVVDTTGNTEKRKYYKVTNVFKVKLKPNRIVKCVDCELRK